MESMTRDLQGSIIIFHFTTKPEIAAAGALMA